MSEIKHVDIAIIGGGMGGCAAALAACHSGKSVILIEETDWLGGQMTAQGVSAFDENEYIETFSGTKSYYELREKIREYVYEQNNIPMSNHPLNPGNGWVSRLCFEPIVGLKAIETMLQPFIDNGQLVILREYRVIAATVSKNVIQSVSIRNVQNDELVIEANYFLDATELGDLLPLTGTAYVTGAEAHSDTGEDNTPDEPLPTEVQSFTYCFAVEFCEGENHRIDKPDGYDYFRDSQPYSLTLKGWDGEPRPFEFFGGDLPFWTYRRLRDGSLLGGNDVALMNWHGNDYFGRNIIDVSAQERERALDEAKRLSLGFLYWLQTECPRDEGGIGYPELKLRKDIMGTEDGLSKVPYIREARRIIPLKRIHAYDITADYQPFARASNHRDSVGVGWYAMDLHPCVGEREINMFTSTKPFQIPLGSIIPNDMANLLPACKNIGTTHFSNGAYRLHPIEWNIGESAGFLAAYCIKNGVSPAQVWQDDFETWRLQYQLLQYGIPIAWMLDVPMENPSFVPLQMLLVCDVLHEDSAAIQTLSINLSEPIPSGTLKPDSVKGFEQLLNDKGFDLPALEDNMTWEELALLYAPIFEQAFAD